MRIASYCLKPATSILILSGLILVSKLAIAAEIATKKEQTDEQQISEPVAIKPQFNVDIEQLAKNNDADESFWLDVSAHRSLVLKYRARGKIFRGNLIMLHAQGEYAGHPRIMSSLAKQMNHLGWHVYVPNLPTEDFLSQKKVTPEEIAAPNSENSPSTLPINSQTENPLENTETPAKTNPTDNLALSTPKSRDHFFSNQKAYQTFITTLLEQITNKMQPKSVVVLLVANQNSAYWLLQPLKASNVFKQLVLIEPQIPQNVESDLENEFDGQSLPVFLFTESIEPDSDFAHSFDRQLWRARTLRISRGIFSNSGIPIEDYSIAKLITGWVSTLQKNN